MDEEADEMLVFEMVILVELDDTEFELFCVGILGVVVVELLVVMVLELL